MARLDRVNRRIGVDPDPDLRPPDGCPIQFIRAFGDALPLPDESVDRVISKSVLKHLANPESVFDEVSRVLKPGGDFVVLTPNGLDYVSLISRAVPNKFHPWVVRIPTGRNEEDTFPTLYRANSRSAIERLAAQSGMRIETLEFLREHPHYLKLSLPTYVVGVAIEQGVQRPLKVFRPWILTVLRKPMVGSS